MSERRQTRFLGLFPTGLLERRQTRVLGLFPHWVGIIALELLWSVAEVLPAEEKAFPAVHASEALVCQ